MGHHPAQALILIAATACTPHAQVIGPGTTATKEPEHVAVKSANPALLLPEVTISGRRPHGEVVVISEWPPYDDFDPPATAKLATTAASATLTKLAGARTAAIAARRAAGRVTIAATEAVRVASDPTKRKALEAKREATRKTMAVAEAARKKASTAAMTALDAHASELTDAGAILRALVTLEMELDGFDELLDLADKTGTYDVPQSPSYDGTLAALAIVTSTFPSSPYIPLARFTTDALRLDVDRDHADTLVDDLFALAHDPKTPPAIVKLAFARVSRETQWDLKRPSRRAIAIESFRWLLANGNDPDRTPNWSYRLGALLVAEHDPAAMTALCTAVTTNGTGAAAFAELAVTAAARVLVDGDPAVLVDACAKATCPCVESVVDLATAQAIARDDDATMRTFLAVAQDKFPNGDSARIEACAKAQLAEAAGDAATAATARSALDTTFAAGSPWAAAHPDARLEGCPSGSVTGLDDVARAERQVARLGALRTCFVEVADAAPRSMTFDVTIGADELATDAHSPSSPYSAAATVCMTNALVRHRWTGLATKRLVIPVNFVED